MGGSQVASEKTDIAIDNLFQNDLAFPGAELASDLQLGSPAHGGDGTSSLAARGV